MIRYFILLVGFVLFQGFTREEIDFNNKKIQKDISKLFEITEFNLEELHTNEETAPHSFSEGKYFKITNRENQIGYLYVGRVNSCRSSGCSSLLTEEMTNSEAEYFDYYMVFNLELTIQSVRVFNYQATHGHEITAKSWLKQFNGHNGSKELAVGKNIDAISGATISVYSITHDIQLKADSLINLMLAQI